MIDRQVKSIVHALSKAEQDNFFENILISLANATGADYVFIAQINRDIQSASTLTAVNNGQLIDNFEYALKGTPCEITQKGNCCVHPSNIQPLYPDDQLLVDMGIQGYAGIPLKNKKNEVDYIVVALFQAPFDNEEDIESLFLLFSGMMLKELEKQFAFEKLRLTDQIISDSNEAIMITDVDTNIIYVNNAFSKITGYAFNDAVGKQPNLLGSGYHDDAFYQELWEQLNSSGHWAGEIHNKKKNGEPFFSKLSINAIRKEDDSQTQYVGFFSDITQDKEKDQEIFQKTHYDSLTGLANRQYLLTRIAQSTDQQSNFQKPFYVLFLDIDHFKDVNDYFGFITGDKLIAQVGTRIQSIIRSNDVLARLTGDQFALLIHGVGEQYLAQHFLERIKRLFKTPIAINDHEHKVSLSIGIAKYPDDTLSAEELLSKSEQALYNAKEKGRNTFTFFTDELQQKVIRRISLKNALKEAIKHNQIDVVYQPIINIETNQICKFEALARWQHNDQYVSPEEFIQIAEEFGLIYDLGLLILRKACGTLKELKAKGWHDIAINVNRSVNEFGPDHAIDSWIQILEDYDLQGSDINFELTESILAPEQKSSLSKLKRLQDNGSKISLDDFGTGYSSLSYLRNFPIDELKIDRSFVMHMHRSEGDIVLIQTIIAMAKSLGITTVAEGIETEEHQQALLDMGCHSGQGYLISKPLPPQDLPGYLDKHQVN